MTKPARVAMNKPFIRETVRLVSAEAAGRQLHTWNDLLGVPAHDRGQDRPHRRRRVVAGRCRARRRRHDLRHAPRRRDAEGRNGDLRRPARLGLSRYRTVWAIDGDRVYGTARTAYGKALRPAGRGPPDAAGDPRRAAAARWSVAPVEVALPVRKGQRLGEVRILDRGTVIARLPLVAADAVAKPGPSDAYASTRDARFTT